MNDGVKIKHDFKFFITRADGRVEETPWIDNLFVRRGMSYLAALQSTTPNSVMNHMHLGSGTVAATLTDIFLGAQTGSRVAMASRTVTGANSNILSEVATFAGFLSGVTSVPLTEIGIFNHATSGGDMRSRAVFSSITLGDSDYLQVSYKQLWAQFSRNISSLCAIYSGMDKKKRTNSLSGRKQSPEHVAKRLASRGLYPPLSEETKQKLRESDHRTEAWKAKIAASLTGRKHTEEEKQKIKDSVHRAYEREDVKEKFRGRVAWNKGKPWSEETKQKLSAYFKGRSNSALIGRHHSEETKAKQRAQKLGGKLSEEHKAKISAAMKGRPPVPYENRPRGEKHHNYGKPAQKGSGIGKGSYCLKGHWVRSTWERGVADWLFQRNIPYEYEPEIFDLGDGVRYRPDFYLPTFDRWIECKGYMDAVAAEKISRFRQDHSLQVIDRKWWRQYTGGCDWIPEKYPGAQ